MNKLPILRPDPNIDRFCQTIRGETIPERPPFVELFLDWQMHKRICEEYLDRPYAYYDKNNLEQRAAYWDNYIEAYYRLGYDFMWVSSGITFPTKFRIAENGRWWTEEGKCLISSWEEFEKYPWPERNHFDLWDFEYVPKHLPDGMGLLVSPCKGFLEIPLEDLIGYEELCMLLYDEPELVDAVFQRVAETELNFYRQVRDIDKVVGFFPGDDMGFNTQTMLSPNDLRRLVLPTHKKAAELAHEKGKLYLLHSCGNLSAIMEDLIEDVKIDAKHSFEDNIMPVGEFKKQYGSRVATLGGVDINKLCTLPEKELRNYIRGILAECAPGGRYCLGTGNSVANYIPLENYLIMQEEGYNWNR